MTGTPTYFSWVDMRRRCNDPKNIGYANYGGRGITVCERWQHSFENFVADMGMRLPGYSIERRNNDGNYEPGNCYWLPKGKQALNRRNNIYVEVGGARVTAKEASRLLGVEYNTFLYRLKSGRSIASMQEAAP